MRKRLLRLGALVLCVILCAAALGGCGAKRINDWSDWGLDANGDPSVKPADTGGEDVPAEQDPGTEKPSGGSVVGSWAYGGEYNYTFRADGTGSYTFGSSTYPFTYTNNGLTLVITFEGPSTAELPYTLEGDKLVILDYYRRPVEYRKR